MPARSFASAIDLATAPLRITQSVQTHPDTALRSLGLIRQEVKVPKFLGSHAVSFSSWDQEWIEEATSKPLPHFTPTTHPLSAKKDTVPDGIIFIVGELSAVEDPAFAAAYETEVRKKSDEFRELLVFKQKVEEQKLRSAGTEADEILPKPNSKFAALVKSLSSQKHVQTGNVSNITEMRNENEYLMPTEIRQYLRQYFFRSIPSAALRAGAIIVTSSPSPPMIDALSAGIHSVNEKHDLRALHIRNNMSFIDDTNSGFSHILELTGGENDDDTKRSVRSFSVLKYAHELVEELHKGYQPACDSTWEPPARNTVSTVVVLAGGKRNEAKHILIPCIVREWPIFIIEGSGGAADELVQTHKAVHNPARASFAELDADYVEIITKARCIIVPKGEVVDTFTQSIAYSLRGDETLRNAWTKYASWAEGTQHFKDMFSSQMFIILILGILAIGVSIFQTFAQLLWPAETATHRDDSKQVDENVVALYTVFSIVVIVLPIGMQLMQTFTNNANAGGKWVALRWASEGILREIYMLRARVGDYSAQKVEQAAQNVRKRREEMHNAARSEKPSASAFEEGKDEMLYSTRQELLHQRLEMHTNELVELLDAAGARHEYEGPIPPEWIEGDDGFSDLTAEQYIARRLEPALHQYDKRTKSISRIRWWLEFFVHILNTSGTILAALSTHVLLKKYNLQAWVAFTTAIVSSLTRFDSWVMLEWRQRKFSETWMRLSTVLSWWSSRGSRAADSNVRDELATMVEEIIRSEVAEFKKQQQVVSQASRKAAEGDDAKDALTDQVTKLARNEMQAITKRFQDMNLSSLNAETIEAALNDPQGASARAVKRVLANLNSEFGDVVSESAAKMREVVKTTRGILESNVTDFAQFASTVVDPLTGCLKGTIEGNALTNLYRFLPMHVLSFVGTPFQRQLFIDQFRKVSPRDTSAFTCASLLHGAAVVDKRLHEQMQCLPTRLLLESVKLVLEEEIEGMFITALENMHLTSDDITPSSESLPKSLLQLKMLTRVPWRNLDHRTLLLLLDDEPKLEALSETKLRAVVRRVESLSGLPPHLKRLREDVENDIAQLDLHDYVFSSPDDRIELLNSLSSVRSISTCSLDLIPMQTIIEFLPERQRSHFLCKDPSIFAAMLQMLDKKMPMALCVECAVARLPKTETRRRFESVMCSAGRIEQLAIACDRVTQIFLLSKSKGAFLRRIAGDFGDNQLVEELRTVPEKDLMSLLSSVRAIALNSFLGRIFDALGEDDASLCLTDMLSYEERALLASRLKEFSTHNVRAMSKQHILSFVAVRKLVVKLQLFGMSQLQCLIQRLLGLQRCYFHSRVLRRVIENDDTRHKMLKIALRRDEEVLIVEQLLDVHPSDLLRFTVGPQAEKVQAYLSTICGHEARNFLRSSYVSAFDAAALITDLHNEVPDRAAFALFSRTAAELVDEKLVESFSAAFSSRILRDDVLRSLCDLIQSHHVLLAFEWLSNRLHEPAKAIVQEIKSVKRSSASCAPPVCSETCGDYSKLYEMLEDTFPHSLDVILFSLLGNVLVRTPLFIFHAVALNIRDWSVRPLFPTLACRLALVPLVFDVHFIQKIDLFDVNVPRDAIFEACEKCPQYRVIDELRALPDDKESEFHPTRSKSKLRQLLRETVHMLNSTAIGRLYMVIHRKRIENRLSNFELSENEEVDLMLAATQIESQILIDHVEVQRHFDGFDSRMFSLRKESSRVEVLSHYLTSEDHIGRVALWREDIFDMLFTYLLTKPVYKARGGMLPRRVKIFTLSIPETRGIPFAESGSGVYLSATLEGYENEVQVKRTKLCHEAPPKWDDMLEFEVSDDTTAQVKFTLRREGESVTESDQDYSAQLRNLSSHIGSGLWLPLGSTGAFIHVKVETITLAQSETLRIFHSGTFARFKAVARFRKVLDDVRIKSPDPRRPDLAQSQLGQSQLDQSQLEQSQAGRSQVDTAVESKKE